MLLNFKKIVMLCLTIGSITGCAVSNPFDPDYDKPFTGTSANEIKDNIDLANKIQKMIEDNYPKSAATVVLCDHFNVLVAGEVNSIATKDKIGEMVKGIPSIKSYNDYMTIQPIDPKLHKNTKATETAQLRINNENNISMENLKVVVVSGAAYVMGNIKPNQTQNLKSAIDGIYSIEGVTLVVDLTKITTYDDTGHSF